MERFKITNNNNKNFIVLIASIAVSSTLVACTPSKINTEQMKEETTTQVVKQASNQAYNIIDLSGKTAQDIKNRNKDAEIEEYLTVFRQEILDLKETAKEKWESEETQEKIENIKQKSKDLFDFVVNGKEINGITFKDLSENGKQTVQNTLRELDSYIELMIPGYKSRFENWLIEKGADAVETYNNAKDWYQDYKEKVMKEYESRNTKSK